VIGVYVHVPHCAVRCSYCDFYLVAGRRHDARRFAAALASEIAAAGRREPVTGRRPPAADTLHLGGGTPSILPAAILAEIVATARSVFHLDPGAEIALEANPEDSGPGAIAAWRAAGFNRLSLGVQSLDDDVLKSLRRSHTAAQAIASVRAARRAGMPHVAVDLILGLPGQGEEAAIEGIDRVVDAGADHVSIYLLEIHPRTRLGRAVGLGLVRPAGEDAAARQYERAAARLESRGLEQYEISNFARPGHRSRHNLKYWTDGDYLGFGPAAHSYFAGRRWSNAPDLRGYLEGEGRATPRLVEEDRSDLRAVEALIAGLRLVEGVDLDRLGRRHGTSIPAADDPRIASLAEQGLLEARGPRLRLSGRGRLLSNEVFERLLPRAGQLT
jgi:oxygen-independent coproporphyrinogen-3 oxidase